MKKSGFFITFEGIDGSGKSTHIKWCMKILKDFNIEVLMTREPGGTIIGDKIRDIFLKYDMNSYTEVLLSLASRTEHIQKVILPAINNGVWVLCDRFTDSTYAYQCGGRDVDINFLDSIINLTRSDFVPNLTILFDIPVSIAKNRLKNKSLDRFERETPIFFEKIRQSYLNLYKKYPNRIIVIDATQPFVLIRKILLNKIQELIKLF